MNPNDHIVPKPEGFRLDWLLLGLVIALIGMGTVVVFSSSAMTLTVSPETKQLVRLPYEYFLSRHLIRVVVGISLLIFFMTLDYHKLRYHIKSVYVAGLVLLVIALFSAKVNGAGGWIMSSHGALQPVELIKLILVIYMADLLERRQRDLQSYFKAFFPSLFITGVTLAVVVKLPDFGGAFIILGIVSIMLWAAGIQFRHLAYTLAVVLPILAVCIYFDAHAKTRITDYIASVFNPGLAHYHIRQAMIAFGYGGWTGVGPGNSVQKLFYLPYPYNDSVFAVVGEELGLLGTLLVVFLFAMVLVRGVHNALRAPDLFGYFLAIGCTMTLTLTAIVHISVITGILPTTGLTLPFISYGGSNLIVSCSAVGVLLSISRYGTQVNVSPGVLVALGRHDKLDQAFYVTKWRTRLVKPVGENA